MELAKNTRVHRDYTSVSGDTHYAATIAEGFVSIRIASPDRAQVQLGMPHEDLAGLGEFIAALTAADPAPAEPESTVVN